MNIQSLFAARTENRPESIALEIFNKKISYRDLDTWSNKFANYLISMGVGSKSIVGIYMNFSPNMIYGILGVIKAGAAFAIINPRYSYDCLVHIKNQTRMSVVLTDSTTEKVDLSDIAQTVDMDYRMEEIVAMSGDKPECCTDEAAAACISYSLGLDNVPVGAIFTQKALLQYCLKISDEFALCENDTVCQLSMDRPETLLKLALPALLSGSRLVIAAGNPSGLSDFNIILQDFKVTVMDIPEETWYLLTKEHLSGKGVPGSDDLRLIVISNGQLLSEYANIWRQVFPERVRITYSYSPREFPLTVTTCDITDEWCKKNSQKKVTLGKPIGGNRVYLLDGFCNPVPVGIPCELHIESDYLPDGYISNPGRSAERFLQNPFSKDGENSKPIYKTGDMVKFLPSKNLELIGSRNLQVTVKGQNISIKDLQLALITLPDIYEAEVVAVDSQGDKDNCEIMAFLRSREGAELSSAALREYLRRDFPVNSMDLKFIVVENLPRFSNGRAEAGILSELYIGAKKLKEDFKLPQNQMEEELYGIWSRVLKTKEFGINENFFEIGGSSLLAMQMAGAVSEATGVEINLRFLIENPTLSSMAAAISRIKEEKKDIGTHEEGTLTIRPDREKRYEPFPLTDVQQAYWLGRSRDFELGNIATHSYFEFESEEIDIERLNLAWQRLIDRHDMLRAVILPDGTQKVLERVEPYRIMVDDLRGSTSHDIDLKINQIRQRMSHQVLKTDQWPLFEICAILYDKATVRLFVSIDALIMDTWSFQIILNDLSVLYQDIDKYLPPLQIGFRDYVMTQNKLYNTSLYQKALDYWMNRLSTLPSAPLLPTAKNPAELQSPRFVRYGGRMEKDDWKRLKKKASREGLTPSALLLAAFSDILRIWSSNESFTINLTLFNHLFNHEEVGKIVGDFTSLTLLEVQSDTASSLRTRAKKIQRQLWEDLDNRYVSGIRVLRELAKVKGSANTLMPIVFTSTLVNNTDYEDENETFDSAGKVVYSITQTPQVWLDHEVYEEKGALIFNWDVIEELFPEGLIKEIFETYSLYLEKLSDEDTWDAVWPDTVRRVTSDKLLEKIRKANNTDSPVPEGLLHSKFISQALNNPENIAVISKDRILTYRELYEVSCTLGSMLRKTAGCPGGFIGVAMEKGWGQVAAVLGILMSGAAYVPIDISYPMERIKYILENAEVKTVVTNGSKNEKLELIQEANLINIDNINVQAEEKMEGLLPQSRQEPAYVIYTSGTTGVPKGVMINHIGAINTIEDINSRFSISSQDRVLALSALNFDLSVYDIFGILSAGGTMVVPDAELLHDPAHWAELVANQKITIWNSVPALMSMLVDYLEGHPDIAVDSIRVALLSGDWIPVTLPDKLRKLNRNVSIISLGGATEASIWSIIYNIGKVEPGWKSIPYGKPMSNQKFYVLNSAMEPCPVWVPGKLYIGGIGLAMGYLNDKEKTDASFITHPKTGERLYRTGDMGRLLPDGNIEFLGREDFQVKVNGYRIELSEIESALLQHNAIKSAIAVAAKNQNNSSYLAAYAVVKNGCKVSQEELKNHLSEKLPKYMIPSAFIFLDRLPVTANGKVDRKALPPPVFEIRTKTEKKAGKSSIEDQVISIVKEVLGADSLNPDDNLLELGANSVDIIRIANQLERQFKVRPKVNEFYKSPRISSICEFYDNAGLNGENATAQKTHGLLNSSVSKAYNIILDPGERDNFRRQQNNIRYKNAQKDQINLIEFNTGISANLNYNIRYSHRSFADEPISFEQFCRFLSCFKQSTMNGKPKYLYGSAGGLYPVQVYLHIKPGSIMGIEEGAYYYNPLSHSILKLSAYEDISQSIDDPFVNNKIYSSAAFAVFLIAQMSAIEPMYGDRSLHYATIEAGLMSQTAESAAASCDIGLCQIGELNFSEIRHLFDLTDNHIHIHSIFGGKAGRDKADEWHSFEESIFMVNESSEREEFII